MRASRSRVLNSFGANENPMVPPTPSLATNCEAITFSSSTDLMTSDRTSFGNSTPFKSGVLVPAIDPNGDPLVLSAEGLPEGLEINASNGVVSGVPSVAGEYQVTFRADDGITPTSVQIVIVVAR